LPIPVFRNLFLGSKKPFLTGFLRISFFSCVFWRNFSQERGFEEVTGIPFFSDFTGIFRRNSCGQEFLWAGIPVFTQDSSGIRRIPVPAESCRLRPATKEGSLLSKIWTKIDIFNLSPEQDLTMVSAAPVLCWRLLA
jgi:hypothetical protein